MADALVALKLLATHPRIEPARIGVLGFSKGGQVALYTELEPFRQAVIADDIRFALHVAFYPYCSDWYMSERLTKAPMLLLLGGQDDYTPAGPCRDYGCPPPRLVIAADGGSPAEAIPKVRGRPGRDVFSRGPDGHGEAIEVDGAVALLARDEIAHEGRAPVRVEVVVGVRVDDDAGLRALRPEPRGRSQPAVAFSEGVV